MSDSESKYESEAESNVEQTDRRVGVEGEGNLIQGDGSGYWDSSQQVGAPISADGDVFAPSFYFGGNQNVAQYNPESFAALPEGWKGDIQSQINERGLEGAARLNEQWLSEQSDQNSAENRALKAWVDSALGRGYTPAPAASSGSNQVGGAVQGSGLVFGGNASAPIATGDDSIAFDVGAGGVGAGGDIYGSQIVTAPVAGPVIGGDVIDSPIFNAPVEAPVVVGDLDQSPIINAPVAGPVIAGDNNAPVIAPLGDVTAPVIAPGGDINAPVVAPQGDVSAPVVTVGGDVDAPVITTGGDVNAPISTGENSPIINVGVDPTAPTDEPTAPVSPITVATGDGVASSNAGTGVAAGGDILAPVVVGSPTAPVAGGDVDISGTFISGNQGPVTIHNQDISEAIAQAAQETARQAVAAAGSSADGARSYYEKALAAVAESRKDPSERISTDMLNTAALVVTILGGIYALTR